MSSWTFSSLKSESGKAERKPILSENVKGAIVVLLGALVMVGAAYGAMQLLIGPDGLATKLAASANTETATHTFYSLAE